MSRGPYRGAVQEGALALECGWDPIRYLDLEGVERLVARAILQEAADRKGDNDKRFWKNVQGAVQNGVARAFGGS